MQTCREVRRQRLASLFYFTSPPEVYLAARINSPKIAIRVWGSSPEQGPFVLPCFGGMLQAGQGGTGPWARGPSHPQHVPLRDRAGSGGCCEGLPLHYRDAGEDEHGEGVARVWLGGGRGQWEGNGLMGYC